jgi:hypothetical protein
LYFLALHGTLFGSGLSMTSLYSVLNWERNWQQSLYLLTSGRARTTFPYLGLSANGLQSSSKAELQGPHSSENLAGAVKNMLIELDLERKLLAITGDNASTRTEWFRSFIMIYNKSSTMSLYSVVQIAYLAHILNLIVKDVLLR